MLDKSRIDTLLKVDPDRYRSALLGTKAQKERLCVTYAFHAELAKIPEMVSEPMIGAIRYQWWRDAIEEIFSGLPVRKHDIALPLAAIVKDCDLSRFQLDSLINGRERDLDSAPFLDIDDARKYCRETSGRIMEVAARVCHQEDADSELILDIGECWGMTGLARSWRYYSGGMLSNLSFQDVLEETEARYRAARGKIGRVPPDLLPAIAYSALIPGYLKIMKAREYDPVNQVPNYGQFAKKSRLLRTTISGKI